MACDICLYYIFILMLYVVGVNMDQQLHCPPDCHCLGLNILCSNTKEQIPWKKLPIWIEKL